MVACSVTVEVAFDSNFTTAAVDRTWTDLSDRLFGQVDINWGRSDQFSNCAPLTCSLTLSNEDGALTPGNASSSYYPNVKLDRPIRVTVTPVGGSPSVRFTGYVDAWPMSWPFGTDLGSVNVNLTATSRSGRLALRNAFRDDLTQSALTVGASSIWSLTGATWARRAISMIDERVLRAVGSGPRLKFTGSAVQFRGGEFLSSMITLGSDYTVALSFRSTTKGGSGLLPATITHAPSLAAANGGRWHRLILTSTAGVGALWLDGIHHTGAVITDSHGALTIGRPTSTRHPYAAVRDIFYMDSAASSGDVASDYAAFRSGVGEVTDDRLVRYAGYAGIPSAEVDADPGAIAMGASDVSGMAALDAFGVVESTEGGVLTDARDGTLRLFGRGARYYTSPTVTLDMTAEEVGADYVTTMDRSGLLNEVTGTNSATNLADDDNEAVSRTYRDGSSINEYGTASSSIEVNAADPDEPYAAAGWLVQNYAEPAPRAPTVSVDLLPLDLSLTEDCMAVFVGDRVSLQGRPSQDATTSQDFFAEGGSESWAADAASVGWTLSNIVLNDSVLRFDAGDHWDAGLHFAR